MKKTHEKTLIVDNNYRYGNCTLADFYNLPSFNDQVLANFNLMHESWQQDDVYRYRTVRLSSSGQYTGVQEKDSLSEKDLIVFAGNDYFGMAQEASVKDAAKRVIDEFGISSTGSAATTGLTKYHVALERQLATIFNKDAALLFNSGFAVNIGCLPPLTKGSIVFCDKLCHSSIQDGLRIASTYGAELLFFRHNDLEHLEDLLRSHRHKKENALIVTEDCFSMDGDFAKLSGIAKLKQKHNAKLYMDCAHGFGILNPVMADGIYAYLTDVDYIMVTFSKLAGAVGGALISDNKTIKYLNFMARSHMFSVTPPPAICAAVSAALNLYLADNARLTKLKHNIAYFREGLVCLGIKSISSDHASPIFPVVIGDELRMSMMTKCLFDHGILVTPIVYPAVSRDQCRFRFTIMSTHTKADLDLAISALGQSLSIGGSGKCALG